MSLNRDQMLNHAAIFSELEEHIDVFASMSYRDDPVGHCWLGLCCARGAGVEQDDDKAVELYRKASDQDHPLGHCWLGQCYENGVGVEMDYTKAVELYRKASDQDYHLGHCWLGECYENGDGVDKNISKAVELYQRAVDKDSGVGMYYLGCCYEHGNGVDKDIKKAALLYKQSFKTFQPAFFSIKLSNYSLDDLNEIKEMCISHSLEHFSASIENYISKHCKSDNYNRICKIGIDVLGQTTCPICLETQSCDDQLFMTKCLHLYHKKCVENQKKCPMCRLDLEEINC